MSKKRYDPRVPRPANGFRAQSLRALPRGAWWAKRWIQAIEQMRLGARAGRGRVYAEQGQVTALTIAGSHVEATVLGARPDPYTVKIDFKGIAGRRGGKAFRSSDRRSQKPELHPPQDSAAGSVRSRPG